MMQRGATDTKSLTRLEKLFNSNKDHITKTRKILAHFEKHPQDIAGRFLLNRTVLHLAVLKELPDVVAFLLKKEPQLVVFADRQGKTPFFDAVDHYDENTFAMLIHCAKDNIEQRDKEGKTLLIYATEIRNIPAMKQLVKAGANIHSNSNNGKSAYSIATEDNANNDLLIALIKLDIPFIHEVYPSSEPSLNKQALEMLSSRFATLHLFEAKHSPQSTGSVSPATESSTSFSSLVSTLPSSSRSESAQSTHSSATSANEISLADLTQGQESKLLDYLISGGDPNVRIFLDRPLILHTFILATPPLLEDIPIDVIQRRKQMVLLLARYADIDATNRRGSQIIHEVAANPQRRIALLQSLKDYLWPEVRSLLAYTQCQIKSYEEMIEICLFQAGLTNKKIKFGTDFYEMNIDFADENESYLTHLLWKICSCLKNDTTDNYFDKQYVANMTQGLLSSVEKHKIVVMLRRMWAHLHSTQQLVAIFIIKELIVSDIQHQIGSNDLFMFQLNILLRTIKTTFSDHGQQFNDFINKMIELKNELLANVIYRNYQILCSWQIHAKAVQYYKPFDHLVKEALTLKQESTKALEIAHEFRAIMLSIFKNIKIDEFYDKAWSSENKSKTAPHVTLHAHVVNSMANYLQMLILQEESSENMAKVIRLLILVATELCTISDGLGPDISSVIAIMAALNSTAIARLKEAFARLDSDMQAKLEKIDELISTTKNSHWLRQVRSACSCPLPHLGLYLTDITFIYDGNSDLGARCQGLGGAFNSMVQLQSALMLHPCHFQTNFYHLLIQGHQLREDDIYDVSRRIVSPLLTIDDLEYTVFYKQIKDLIDKNILPRIRFEQNEYPSTQCYIPIFKKITNHFAKRESPQTIRHTLIRARKLIGDIIALINQKQPGYTVNYVYYLNQLPLDFQPPPQEQNTLTMDVSEPVMLSTTGAPITTISQTTKSSSSSVELTVSRAVRASTDQALHRSTNTLPRVLRSSSTHRPFKK